MTCRSMQFLYCAWPVNLRGNELFNSFMVHGSQIHLLKLLTRLCLLPLSTCIKSCNKKQHLKLPLFTELNNSDSRGNLSPFREFLSKGWTSSTMMVNCFGYTGWKPTIWFSFNIFRIVKSNISFKKVHTRYGKIYRPFSSPQTKELLGLINCPVIHIFLGHSIYFLFLNGASFLLNIY